MADELQLDDLPREDGRALIIGQTGSGKTQLAIYMLRRLAPSPIVIFDTKGEKKFSDLPTAETVTSWDQVGAAAEKDGVHYIVFACPPDLAADPSALDDLLMEYYEDFKGLPIYLDELYSFHQAGRAGPGLQAIQTRGRSDGIACLMATQRPAWISGFSMSESDRFYVFDLIRKKDRKIVADFVPDFDRLPSPEPFGFYYYDAKAKTEPRLVAPIAPDKPIDTTPGDGVKVSSDAERRPAEIHDWI